jgi:hypothetical protein
VINILGLHLLNGCQRKAIVGGLTVAAGGVVMLLGVALVVVSGVAGKGPLAPVVDVAGGYLAGARKVSGGRTPTASPPSTSRTEYNRYLRSVDQKTAADEKKRSSTQEKGFPSDTEDDFVAA